MVFTAHLASCRHLAVGDDFLCVKCKQQYKSLSSRGNITAGIDSREPPCPWHPVTPSHLCPQSELCHSHAHKRVSAYITMPLSPVTHTGAAERSGEHRRPQVCHLSFHIHEPTPPSFTQTPERYNQPVPSRPVPPVPH
ncbi:hypothetical protein AMELA_G00285260 [Ameiurus melas]|uniref:Uncharacterized protein n=1 Tax=Ameiurus melas TaxID=219545 RepID=A0A7J5ZID0_AMEME|nr:hypothetical protein AMELA_G00285260 [Ameiurus melas]